MRTTPSLTHPYDTHTHHHTCMRTTPSSTHPYDTHTHHVHTCMCTTPSLTRDTPISDNRLSRKRRKRHILTTIDRPIMLVLPISDATQSFFTTETSPFWSAYTFPRSPACLRGIIKNKTLHLTHGFSKCVVLLCFIRIP